MAQNSNAIDPQWAWDTYQPDTKAPWSRRLAAHLYRRAGFAGTWKQLNDAVELGPQKTVALLMDPGSAAGQKKSLDSFEQNIKIINRTMMGSDSSQTLAAAWLYRMLNTPHQVLEKTTLFWHGHFATSAAKVTNAQMMRAQNELLRKHALSRFEPLVLAMSRDAAMLLWLDAAVNHKSRPNENYARELMELFCLGEGNYTEQDIKQVARTFTGWELRQGEFRFNKYQHDEGIKKFLGKSGNFNGDDAVRIVLEQPAASRFIATKLVRYFVMDELPAEESFIEPLAKQLRDNGFVIGPVIGRIISSNVFYSRHAIGAKVRSPIELSVGLIRALEARTNLNLLAQATGRLGQGLYYPPSVKGWDGGRTWINSSTLLGRANLVRQILSAKATKYRAGGLSQIVDQANASKPDQAVDFFLDLLVAVDIPNSARKPLVELASRAGDRNKNLGLLINAISTLPEFQLC